MFGKDGLFVTIIIASLLAGNVYAKRHKHCPKKETTFDRRINDCYLPLSEHHNPSDPKEYCGDYQSMLSCVTNLVDRCTHRRWLHHKMDDMDQRVAQLSRMVGLTC